MLWTPWTIWSLPPKTFQITNCRLHFGDCITISHRVFRKTAFKMFKIFGHFPLFFIQRVNYLISIPCNLIWSTSLIAYLCWNHNKSPIHPKYINVENSKCCKNILRLWISRKIWSVSPKTFQWTNAWQHFERDTTISHRVFWNNNF